MSISKKESKKSKVGFILCCRAETDKALQQNETFYQLIFNELMNTDDYELDGDASYTAHNGEPLYILDNGETCQNIINNTTILIF